LSRKYEASGNSATISRTKGDPGGASYGLYQLTKNTGSAQSFVNYLRVANPTIYELFAGKTVGSTDFDKAWKRAASVGSFEKYQHDFIQQRFYSPAVASIKKSTGLDVNNRSIAVQNAIWSTAVQHGQSGANKILRNAGVTPSMSDAEIIRRVYQERSANNGKKYFPSSSEAVRKGVVNRFKSELKDAFKMLGSGY
jgi:hypothetical protein